MSYQTGTVTHNLMRMRGVWHDHIQIYDLTGNPLEEDSKSGSPGASPYDNLVYIDFDGERYVQTNVTFRGRPFHARTFTGRIVEGVLHFDKLGPNDPGHIGVSGGPGILFFIAGQVTDAMWRYSEPDCVRLFGSSERTRTTVLYRDGIPIRTLTANGMKLAPTAALRLSWDPRGTDGPPHVDHEDTQVFRNDS